MASARQLEVFEADSPFADLKITTHKPLRETDALGRQKCPSCTHSRKIYCPVCHIPILKEGYTMPQIELPLSVDIIKHTKEKDTKSTAVHAKLVAPGQVTIYPFPDFPGGYDPEKTVLLFPSKDASTFDEIGDLSSINKVVFIDCTWKQTYGITTHPALKDLKKIRLETIHTRFWRVQGHLPPTYLATIEAIHQFFRQYHISMMKRVDPAHLHADPDSLYDGRYDDLLYLFSHQYEHIQDQYRSGPYKDHTSLKLNKLGYIDYSKGTGEKRQRSSEQEGQSGRSESGQEDGSTRNPVREELGDEGSAHDVQKRKIGES
eukprot:comp8507_c0_seq1/m.3817 comp8507_c0_seq1/g.3817  ORF comp8507_c0_seq1/g.3817 comp8507_c0_seq1/m.3817 type:complete len:318 (-) comp8507_c0_seq1:52-1005(-)